MSGKTTIHFGKYDYYGYTRRLVYAETPTTWETDMDPENAEYNRLSIGLLEALVLHGNIQAL
jgi:hypothetical protein